MLRSPPNTRDKLKAIRILLRLFLRHKVRLKIRPLRPRFDLVWPNNRPVDARDKPSTSQQPRSRACHVAMADDYLSSAPLVNCRGPVPIFMSSVFFAIPLVFSPDDISTSV
jgi:hypothetical protein